MPSDTPAPTELERRLAAVMAMDTAAYSRMMEADVEGTHRRLRSIMAEVVAPSVAAEAGRIVKGTGDGIIAEFPSVSRAVRAGLQIQKETVSREEAEPIERRIRFRIGINLADIIVDQGDIFGDGVNIAARLEGVGQPGDIILSEAAAQTADRTGLHFVDLGQLTLKNITRPVRAFRVLPANGEGGGEPAPVNALVPGFGFRPAIGVLPIVPAVAGDLSEEAFADALTVEVILALSCWRSFPVIARNAMFSYKGRQVDIRTVGQEVGARFVLDGSIRRSGSRGRVTVQLSDAETATSLFTERFDFDSSDAFDLQDEIARSIVGALEPELLRHERDRSARTSSAHNATAYECFQFAMWHHFRFTPESHREACRFAKRALELDPGYAQAAAGLAVTMCHAVASRWVDDPKSVLAEGLDYARRAVVMDPRDPLARFSLGFLSHWNGLRDQAEQELKEAIRLDPSFAWARANLAFVYNYRNEPEKARSEIELALRLSRNDPSRFAWLPALAGSHYLSGRFKEALAAAQEALTLRPDYLIAVRWMVASLGQLGFASHAKPLLPLMVRLDGGLEKTLAALRTWFVEPAVEKIADGLRKAGYT
ncbi:MAG TPA: tetratricopeptide repeat protein [Acetobacteraceae bacterium]|nr:tetratricopeptide repeat protein [Acetobacteraceae bacterium]